MCGTCSRSTMVLAARMAPFSTVVSSTRSLSSRGFRSASTCAIFFLKESVCPTTKESICAATAAAVAVTAAAAAAAAAAVATIAPVVASIAAARHCPPAVPRLATVAATVAVVITVVARVAAARRRRPAVSRLAARRPHAAAARRQTDRLHVVITPAIVLLTLALRPAALPRRSHRAVALARVVVSLSRRHRSALPRSLPLVSSLIATLLPQSPLVVPPAQLLRVHPAGLSPCVGVDGAKRGYSTY